MSEENKLTVDILQLIETVYGQGLVLLKDGRKGSPRRIEITPWAINVDIALVGHFGGATFPIDDVEEILVIRRESDRGEESEKLTT